MVEHHQNVNNNYYHLAVNQIFAHNTIPAVLVLNIVCTFAVQLNNQRSG